MTFFAINNTLSEEVSEEQYKLGFGSCAGAGMKFTSRFMNGVLNRITRFLVPKGGIILWSGLETNVPDGWNICDGLNGTPNLGDRVVMGAGIQFQAGTVGGKLVSTTGATSDTVEVAAGTGATVAASTHTHTNANLQPFHTLVYIQKA